MRLAFSACWDEIRTGQMSAHEEAGYFDWPLSSTLRNRSEPMRRPVQIFTKTHKGTHTDHMHDQAHTYMLVVMHRPIINRRINSFASKIKSTAAIHFLVDLSTCLDPSEIIRN